MDEKEQKIYDIYNLFAAPLPKEAIEHAPKEITRKGYDTTGYQYQYVVERLNEVCGIDGWFFEHEILKEEEGIRGKYDKKYYEVTVQVTLTIKKDENNISHTGIGGHRAEMYADALKGAITGGFKKSAAFFGIGQDAYKGILDEDYRPVPVNGSASKQNSKNETTNNYKFLKIMKEQKNRIGDMKYYKVLHDAGYNHANEVVKRNEQEKIFHSVENIFDLRKGCTKNAETCENSYFQNGQAGCKYGDTICEYYNKTENK